MANWRLEDVWNDALITERREIKPRDYIYASEIGKNYWERYHKMMGVPETNHFDARILRKFAAGDLFEEVVGMILRKCGILIAEQERVELPATDKHLRVSGRIDFHAGGISDWSEAKARIETEDYPDAMKNICHKIIAKFEKEYPAGLDNKIIEVKSVNSMLFWAKKDYLLDAYPWHKFQLLTYLIALQKHGKIFYISKDDLTVKEFDFEPTDELKEAYYKDLTEMTYYYTNKIVPPKPDAVIFDQRKTYSFAAKKELEKVGTGKQVYDLMKPYVTNLVEVTSAYKVKLQGAHEVNWEYERSCYRDMLTGTTNEDEWEDWYSDRSAEARDKDKARKEAFLNKLKTLTK